MFLVSLDFLHTSPHFFDFGSFFAIFLPALFGGGGGGGGGGGVISMTGVGFFFAFRRPVGLGGGLRTKGLMSSSAFRFVPPLGSGLRLVGAGLGSLAGPAFRLVRNETTLERMARAFARPGVSGSRRVHPAGRTGLSARRGLRSRVPTPIMGAALIFPIRPLKLGGADGGRSGSAGGAEGIGMVKPAGGRPAEELDDPPPIAPV